MLAPDLPDTHLPGRGEGELQRPLGARGERVDLLPRVAEELLEATAHPVYVGAGALQGLGRHVVAGHDAREQVIRANSSRPRGTGRRLAGTHDSLLRLPGERVEQTALPALLLLYEVLEHRERVVPALRAPDHAELPRALRAQIIGHPPVPLLLEDLYARRPDPTVLTYHPSKASCIKSSYSLIPHSGINRNSKNLSLSRSYFITLSQQIKARASVLIVFADRLARTGPSLLHCRHQELRQALLRITRRGVATRSTCFPNFGCTEF